MTGPRELTQPPPDESPDWSEVPEGFVVEWVEDERSALVEPGDLRGCRRPGCRRPAVWKLLRSNGWWCYCDWHTYGRRIEPDAVLARRYRRLDEVTP